MKDIFGCDVAVGDTVAFVPPFIKTMTVGVIVKFTPTGVQIQFESPFTTKKEYQTKFVKEGQFVLKQNKTE